MRRLLVSMALALVASACGGGNDTAETPGAEAATTTTSAPTSDPSRTDSGDVEPADGGAEPSTRSVTSADGLVTVEAVTELDISVTQIGDAATGFGPVYSLEPDGATFEAPVVITNRLDVTDGVVHLQFPVIREGDGPWELLDDLSLLITPNGATFSGTTTHFSEWAVRIGGFMELALGFEGSGGRGRTVDGVPYAAKIVLDPETLLTGSLVVFGGGLPVVSTGPETAVIGFIGGTDVDFIVQVSDGVFVDDSFQLPDRWSFNIGFRFDESDSAPTEVPRVFYVSPRLGGVTYTARYAQGPLSSYRESTGDSANLMGPVTQTWTEAAIKFTVPHDRSATLQFTLRPADLGLSGLFYTIGPNFTSFFDTATGESGPIGDEWDPETQELLITCDQLGGRIPEDGSGVFVFFGANSPSDPLAQIEAGVAFIPAEISESDFINPREYRLGCRLRF